MDGRHSENRKAGSDAYPGCRTCDDFKTWSKKHGSGSMKKVDNRQNQTKQIVQTERTDCPLDKSDLGKSTWGLLHTISVAYPENPTDDQKCDVTRFIDVLSRIYPCEYCAKDLQLDLVQNPVDASSRDKFSLWLCKLHNRINEKIGKPVFDCTKVYERWKDGWLDGSCD